MRKKFLLMLAALSGMTAHAQDSLMTTTLDEVVVTGTRFQLPVGKSGKTIYKLDRAAIARNAGKTLADLLNEVPGIQTDGNFSAPGANVSYYVRGGRNKHTLILIDGVPMNDPSSISAEYDLRYIPISQIESVEVLKGGLSTLYGTGAAAGVIHIRLRDPGSARLKGHVDVNAGSYKTFSQNAHAGGRAGKINYLVSASNLNAGGFSSAMDNDPAVAFDNDGINRQNGLMKIAWAIDPSLSIDVYSAAEAFSADYDDYEFTDAPNRQHFKQFRAGIQPKWSYDRGTVEARFSYHVNERIFRSSFPEALSGKNIQAEVVSRHRLSDHVQALTGMTWQGMSFASHAVVSDDTARFSTVDPYVSLFVDLPSGLNVHAGARFNIHSLYGAQMVYNFNPSFMFNKNGMWRYKALASLSTSYITPSLYQFYSSYGNKELDPERSTNAEAGLSAYHQRLAVNTVFFVRHEQDPIDFVTRVDEQGNYIGGQYRNLTAERKVTGIEADASYTLSRAISVSAHGALLSTDQPQSFYKIPGARYGAALVIEPLPGSTFSLKYNYTGERTIFDFFSFSEITLDPYHLVDVYAEYRFSGNTFVLYGGINNLFDRDFVALYGYTTRGRNFSAGVRYDF